MNPLLTNETVSRLEAEMKRSLEYWKERSEQDDPPSWDNLKENIEVAMALIAYWREQERLLSESEAQPNLPFTTEQCRHCGRKFGDHRGQAPHYCIVGRGPVKAWDEHKWVETTFEPDPVCRHCGRPSSAHSRFGKVLQCRSGDEFNELLTTSFEP